MSKRKTPLETVEVPLNKYCHIVYGLGKSKRNKIYKTEDILVNINFLGNNPACVIYDANTKKVLHTLSNVDINCITVSEYGNEYDLVGYERSKRKKDTLYKAMVFTDSDSGRNPDGQMLFSGFDLADAFSDNFKNYLCKKKS